MNDLASVVLIVMTSTWIAVILAYVVALYDS